MRSVPPISPVFPEVRRTRTGVTYDVHHRHPQLEFNLVMGGHGTLDVDGERHELSAGTAIWLLPLQDHLLQRSADFDMWMAIGEADWFDAAFLESVASCRPRMLASSDVVMLDQLLSKIAEDSEELETYRAGITYAIRTARRTCALSAGPASGRLHPAVLTALSILRNSPEAPGSAELARKCGITSDYLGQLLLEQTGRGLVEWRNRTRLERFHLLFPESDDLLTAALAAGFGSYTQFHRVFSELVGTTPGQWAKAGGGLEFHATDGGGGELDHCIWEPLSGAIHPVIRDWMNPGFAAQFLLAPEDPGAPPVEAGIGELEELRYCESLLVSELGAEDDPTARLLARTLAEHDALESFKRVYSFYGMPLTDLGNLVGCLIATCWTTANGHPILSPEVMQGVAGRARHAIHRSGQLEAATAADRRKLAAAMVVQCAFTRNVQLDARTSGSQQRCERAGEIVTAAMRQGLGLELAELRLG